MGFDQFNIDKSIEIAKNITDTHQLEIRIF